MVKGMEGYGIYWSIVEMLRDSGDYMLSLCDAEAMAFQLHCEESKITSIIKDFDLFKITKDGKFWSQSLIERMEKWEEKRQKARESALVRWEKEKGKPKKKKKEKYDLEAPIEYLNKVSNKNFDAKNKSSQTFVRARYEEGRTIDDFKVVIDKKCSQWLDGEMCQYLRPSTLFNAAKFENYLNESDGKSKALQELENMTEGNYA